MTVIETNDMNFNDDVTRADVAIIDFWAPWCGPCRAFGPVFEASAVAHADVAHLKVNVDDNPALSQYFAVQSIPTTVAIREGMVLGSVIGAMGADALEALIVEVQGIDMDAIRTQIGDTPYTS